MAGVYGVDSGTQAEAMRNSVKNILGKDDFLKLLITQLKYQDPMEPTDNKDFIAQMAQFSSLEQMANISAGFEKMAAVQEQSLREYAVGQAVNLIGHTVSVILPMEMVTGKVNDGPAKLYLEPDDTSMVVQTIPGNTAFTVTGGSGDMLEIVLANGITGYINEADVTLDDNPRLVGQVTGMKIVDGAPNIVVNGKTVPISLVEEVS